MSTQATLPSDKLPKLIETHKLTKICRDFYLGYPKVINDTYIPKWIGETEELYRVRIASTAFSNFFAPVVDGLGGLITKKEPIPENMDQYDFTNVDNKGSSLSVFVRDVCIASLIAGVEFIAVESANENNQVFFKRYAYEDLYSYYIEDNILKQIVFREKIEQKSGDFGLEDKERYLVFNENGGEVWYQHEKSQMQKQEEWSNTLGAVPVVAVTTGKEISDFTYVSRFLDMAGLNQVQLNLESNLANVLSVIGNPIAVFYGTPPESSVKLNVRQGLSFEDKSREGFEYVEIKGTSVSKIEDKIKDVEALIDKLAFSLLQKTESKTVIDAQESQSKNTSFLSMVAIELESTINQLYRWASELSGKPLADNAYIHFKKDFDDILHSDAQLKIMYDLVMSGDLSRQTFWEKLKSIKALPKEFDKDKEEALLAETTTPREEEEEEEDE